ncbi:MAG: ABC transporter permease, partial [Bacteroidota bacterium]
MFKSYFRIAWRNLLKRKVFATINILGLALGFGSSILLYLFMTHHLSFDKFHENSERIYRFTTEEHRDLIDYEASVPPGFAKVFRDNYEYSEKVAKMVIQWGLVLDVEKSSGVVSKFKEDVQFVEEDFFKIFNFPLINGTNSVPLSAPNTAVITSGVAQKMFGTTNAVGKTFILENDITVEVTGVLQNIPRTSFLQSEVFVSFESLPSFFGFAASESWGG